MKFNLLQSHYHWGVPVPILIACFTRHQKLQRVLEPLVGLPNPIFVVQDNPRNDSDVKNVVEVQKVLQNSQLRIQETLTFQNNQGTNAVALGIDWVLKSNWAVIVIEEDVLISKQFIVFAEEMLERYKEDNRIGSITAMNSVPSEHLTFSEDPYRYSVYFYAWGWATWQD